MASGDVAFEVTGLSGIELLKSAPPFPPKSKAVLSGAGDSIVIETDGTPPVIDQYKQYKLTITEV